MPIRRTELALFLVAGVAAGGVSLAFGQSQNFDVFHAAARALIHGHDLYAKNAADYFKYSPTFALLFVPFTWGPPWLMAPLWSAINFGLAGWALQRVSNGYARQKRIAPMVAFAGIVVSTDGDQSNLLVAGMALLAFVAYEQGHFRATAYLIAGSALIKIFPIVLLSLAIFLPPEPRRRLLYAAAEALLVGLERIS